MLNYKPLNRSLKKTINDWQVLRNIENAHIEGEITATITYLKDLLEHYEYLISIFEVREEHQQMVINLKKIIGDEELI
jgi:hypothetical protein